MNWQEVRRDFPALERHTYLNAAAAGPTPRPVSEAVAGYLRQLEADGDLHWDEWLERQERARRRVAGFLNAEPDEIAFVANTSTGINLIVDLLGQQGPVLSDELEFPTVTLPWIHRGAQVHLLPARNGVVEPADFASGRAPEAATIAVSHVQFSNGCRQDLDAFGALKGDRSLVVCASQSLGAFPVDVRSARIDALASAGHKWLCAGYGAGLLYLSRELLERHPAARIGWMSVEDPYAFDNRSFRVLSTARRVEVGCPAFAGVFALEAAIAYLQDLGLDAISARVLELNEMLTAALEQRGLEVLSPGGSHRSGQTLVAAPDPERAAAGLAEQGILVTRKPQGVRIATHFFNTPEEVERAAGVLASLVAAHPC
jgi:selenocysteine lyase/cysteine desulfurase